MSKKKTKHVIPSLPHSFVYKQSRPDMCYLVTSTYIMTLKSVTDQFITRCGVTDLMSSVSVTSS